MVFFKQFHYIHIENVYGFAWHFKSTATQTYVCVCMWVCNFQFGGVEKPFLPGNIFKCNSQNKINDFSFNGATAVATACIHP